MRRTLLYTIIYIYYILLYSINPLSPFSTDPKYMTFADSELLECSSYVIVLRFSILSSVIFFLLIYCRVCLRSGTARDPHRSAGSGVYDRNPPNIWNRRDSTSSKR